MKDGTDRGTTATSHNIKYVIGKGKCPMLREGKTNCGEPEISRGFFFISSEIW